MAEPEPERELPRWLRPFDRGAWAWLLLALALFVAVRAPALTRSLWFDETWSVAAARKPPAELVAWLPREDTHPPGYYVALGAWLAIVPGDLGARAFSLVANALLVVVLALTAWRCWGRRAAVSVALLAAVSPALAWPGYEVRSFALAALLVATAWWLATVCLATGARWPWLLVGVSAAAALYAFYYAAVGLVALDAFVLAARPRRRDVLGLAAAASVAALVFWPWLPALVEQRAHVAAKTEAGDSGLRWDLAWFGHTWLHGHVVRLGPWSLLLVVVPVVALAILLRRRIWLGRGPTEARPWLRAIAVGTGTFLLGVVAIGAAGSFVRVSYATVLAGLWCLLLVGAAERLRPRARLTLLAVLIAVGTGRSLQASFRAERTDWRGAVAELEARRAPGDVVLAVPWWEKVAYEHYAPGGGSVVGLAVASDPKNVHAVQDEDGLVNALYEFRLPSLPAPAAWLVGSAALASDRHAADAERWRARLTALGWRRVQTLPAKGVGIERWEPAP